MISVYTERYQKLLERLQSARRDAGLTQLAVAEAFGKPQSFVSKCESGERRIDVVELGVFASLYHKPLAYFVGEAEPASGAGLLVDRAPLRTAPGDAVLGSAPKPATAAHPAPKTARRVPARSRKR
jgi:transcriptional regulator with XRE-family HTH domain